MAESGRFLALLVALAAGVALADDPPAMPTVRDAESAVRQRANAALPKRPTDNGSERQRVVAVQVARDVAWVSVDEGEFGPTTERRWVRTGKTYVQDPARRGDLLCDHALFADSMSADIFNHEVGRLLAPERKPGISEKEKDRAKRDRERDEEPLRQRWVADVGLVKSVKDGREIGRENAFVVSVNTGVTRVDVILTPRADETADALRKRLDSIGVGDRVYFRGKPRQWWPAEDGRTPGIHVIALFIEPAEIATE